MYDNVRLSPSNSKMWINCPGSINFINSKIAENIPQSDFAEEGTVAHDLANILLTVDDEKLFDLVNSKHVLTYIDYVKNIKGTKFYEKKVDLSFLLGSERIGTIDCLVISENNKHLDIIDLKYGKYVKEVATNNSQLAIYALGAINEYEWLYNIETISLHIVQPRQDNISIWDMSYEELISYGEYIKSKVEETKKQDAQIIPSADACRWCLANKICEVAYKKPKKKTLEFDVLD